MSTIPRPRVFLDVNIGEEPAGRLTVELFTDHTPRTAENFRQLCTGERDGLTYQKTPFHRIIDTFMVQGGDIEKGDGTGVVSIYGREFEDENIGWREIDAAGLVCAANRGRDTNGSQFFITIEPQPQLTNKHTVFGRLVSGEDTLRKMAKVEVADDTYRPLQPVLVSRCGELERKKKKTLHPQPEPPSQVSSRDRGRRRRSNSGDVQMENSPVPPSRPDKYRRTSDNLVDEGLRGRPRQRSNSRSRSRSPSPEKDDYGSDGSSPARKHKRKRSASPSRHVDDDGSYRRRRRSLPNQYEDDRRRDDRRAGRRRDDDGDDDGNRYRPSPRRDDYRHQNRRWDGDSYRPGRDRDSRGDGRLGDGRLGGGGGDDLDPPVKFKGRGVMKYRDPDRAW